MQRSRHPLQCAVIALIAVCSLIPLVSLVLPLPRTTLHGVEANYSFPRFTLAAATKGSFQGRADVWALRSHPLWGWSVRITNQLTYSLLGEVSLDYKTSVQGGNEGFLWQPMYLRAFNRTKPPPRKKIKETFRELKQLQDFLLAKGIPLVAVINPNLITLYPELLPERYKAVNDRESSYDVSLRAISESKPLVLDAFRLLRDKQGTFPFRFFEPTGSHWNDVGSCLTAQEVARSLELSWREGLAELPCEKYSMESPPRPAELDLVEIANLLTPEDVFKPAPYLSEHASNSKKKRRKVLLIGTSFLFGLEHQLLTHGIADSTTLLFYFRQTRTDGKGSFHPFDRKKLAAEEILSYDAVVIDANVAGPGILGYGFLSFARQRFGLPAVPEITRRSAGLPPQ